MDEGCLDISEWKVRSDSHVIHKSTFHSWLDFLKLASSWKLTPKDSFLNGSAIIQKQACQVIFETIPLSYLNLDIKFPSLPSFLPSFVFAFRNYRVLSA